MTDAKERMFDTSEANLAETPKSLLLSTLGLSYVLDALRDREAEDLLGLSAGESEKVFTKFDEKREELLFAHNITLFSENIDKAHKAGTITDDMKQTFEDQLGALTLEQFKEDNEVMLVVPLEEQGNSTLCKISGNLTLEDVDKIIELKNDIREFLEK